jgi:hypothetical protein
MIQTLEAVINKQGKIQLLEPIYLKVNRRALVMILDEEPIIADDRYDSPPKPRGMGRYRSGRSDVSQNAEILLRNRTGKKKCL